MKSYQLSDYPPQNCINLHNSQHPFNKIPPWFPALPQNFFTLSAAALSGNNSIQINDIPNIVSKTITNPKQWYLRRIETTLFPENKKNGELRAWNPHSVPPMFYLSIRDSLSTDALYVSAWLGLLWINSSFHNAIIDGLPPVGEVYPKWLYYMAMVVRHTETPGLREASFSDDISRMILPEMGLSDDLWNWRSCIWYQLLSIKFTSQITCNLDAWNIEYAEIMFEINDFQM